ncbi:hypothetical protein P43SY_009011 [Pythium insidiosum]|uniref:C2 domain-containing protein n=1 Tax=Pythium insidiosum TaxID=114742 RepID=A0AAD5MDA3_PYTIN|nr:hypothetical protein P43SY_009011 [Pythium insidiosum]
MMEAVDTGDGDASHRQQEKDAADDSGGGDHPVTRPRGQSDAARRDSTEEQRATRHQAATRRSLLHNRFLSRRSITRKEGDSPQREDNQKEEEEGAKTGKSRDQLEPQRDEDEDDDADDESTALQQAGGLTTLVVVRKRSSALESANSNATQERSSAGAGSSRRRRRLTSQEEQAAEQRLQRQARAARERVIVPPARHLIPALALSSSQWTTELDDAAASGFVVDAKREQLANIAPSTLVRLEDRLSRELNGRRATRDSKGDETTKALLPVGEQVRLNDLVAPRPQSTTTPSASTCPHPQPHPQPQLHPQDLSSVDSTPLASLEIVIDRLVLDDHESFSLADRVESQLRSLHRSYVHVLQAQRWRPSLDRLDAFVASDQRSALGPWRQQTLIDADALLDALRSLQQLHHELQSRWHELQQCYRFATDRATRFHLETVPRHDRIELHPVRAFLELLTLDGSDPAADREHQALARRLDELEAKDQCLHHVLRLDLVQVDAASSSPPTLAASGPRDWLCWPAAPLQFYATLHVNGHQVGRTQYRSWSDTGIVSFHETLRLRLRHLPDAVTVQVWQRGWVLDSLLSSTQLPLLVPGRDDLARLSPSEPRVAASISPSREWYQFSRVAPMPRARWHASFLNSPVLANAERRTHGRVLVRVAWVDTGESDALAVLPPPRPLSFASASIASGRLVGPALSSALASRQHSSFAFERDFLRHVQRLDVDRRDPENAAVARLQDRLGAAVLHHRRDVFRTSALSLDGAARLTPWLPSRLPLTRRNALLQLRDREHVERHGTSVSWATAVRPPPAKAAFVHAALEDPMPLRDAEITADARLLELWRPELRTFGRAQRLADARAASATAPTTADSVERQQQLQRFRILDFVDRVRTSHLAVDRRQQHVRRGDDGVALRPTPSLASILQEQPMPLIPGGLDLSGLAQLLAPRGRRLRPSVQRRSAPATPADWPHHCDVYVQVKSASNVPLRRRPADKGADVDTDAKGEPATADALVFVEISFQGQRRRTTPVLARRDAASAVWMETLALPFQAPLDDWSPASIQRSRDVLRLSLFDQRTVRAEGRESESSRPAFQVENRFLGAVDVPFSTLYHHPRGLLDATLRCETPPVHVGYVNVGAHRHVASERNGDDDGGGVQRSRREATFLSFMLTLHPLLPPPTPPEPTGLTTDADVLVRYARDWARSVRSGLSPATRGRDLDVLVRSLQGGRGTFLPRFLSGPPLAPPPGLSTLAQLVRYVALVPFLQDWHLFDGELDVWCTPQEFLELNAGDHEEHAVLLCHFLRWLDARERRSTQTYIVLGSAVPEGKTVYVLRGTVLWNASTGVGYSVRDERCPLLDVALVVSPTNVFANLQAVAHVTELNWDIETNAKAWRPFFPARGDAQLASTALAPLGDRRELVYAETPPELVQDVEQTLRETLKLEIRRWRSTRFTTTFNMDLGLKLRAELERLEARAMGDSPPQTRDPIAELMRTRDVNGLPLHSTFTDVQQIVELVKSANIHWHADPSVEFGLGVYVRGYPNCVLSVWVYLVAVASLD